MVDRDLIIAKAATVKKHIKRIEAKRETDLHTFTEDNGYCNTVSR